MSGTACDSNAKCTEKTEKCGFFQMQNDTKDKPTSSNLCVNETYCNALGRLNGVEWFLSCWADAEAGKTPVAPTKVDDPKKYLAAIEDLITKKNQDWNGLNNLFVSPKFQWQDGWWAERMNKDGTGAGGVESAIYDKTKDGKELFFETDKSKYKYCQIAANCDDEKT